MDTLAQENFLQAIEGEKQKRESLSLELTKSRMACGIHQMESERLQTENFQLLDKIRSL
jgi:hypothetical protein